MCKFFKSDEIFIFKRYNFQLYAFYCCLTRKFCTYFCSTGEFCNILFDCRISYIFLIDWRTFYLFLFDWRIQDSSRMNLFYIFFISKSTSSKNQKQNLVLIKFSKQKRTEEEDTKRRTYVL